jgi:hypothetical protein
MISGVSAAAGGTSCATACASATAGGASAAAARGFLTTAFLAGAFRFFVFAAFLPAAYSFRVLAAILPTTLIFRVRAAFFAVELRPLGMGSSTPPSSPQTAPPVPESPHSQLLAAANSLSLLQQ